MGVGYVLGCDEGFDDEDGDGDGPAEGDGDRADGMLYVTAAGPGRVIDSVSHWAWGEGGWDISCSWKNGLVFEVGFALLRLLDEDGRWGF